jgi:hypothetical protein
MQKTWSSNLRDLYWLMSGDFSTPWKNVASKEERANRWQNHGMWFDVLQSTCVHCWEQSYLQWRHSNSYRRLSKVHFTPAFHSWLWSILFPSCPIADFTIETFYSRWMSVCRLNSCIQMSIAFVVQCSILGFMWVTKWGWSDDWKLARIDQTSQKRCLNSHDDQVSERLKASDHISVDETWLCHTRYLDQQRRGEISTSSQIFVVLRP